ncbi:hypothetical protein Golob_012915, partial [Gossypium lobatum]|nr:hypothetical protein [Gossypium lobatum]
AEDQILQCHICNLPGPPSLFIEPYLREVGFWNVALVGQGCKLDSKLISALFGLPMDGSVVTTFIQFGDWRGECGELLGLVPEMFYGDHRRYPNDGQVTNTRPLRWLLKLIDFRGLGELSRGSVVLATLY